jgi:hypothetical protein
MMSRVDWRSMEEGWENRRLNVFTTSRLCFIRAKGALVIQYDGETAELALHCYRPKYIRYHSPSSHLSHHI